MATKKKAPKKKAMPSKRKFPKAKPGKTDFIKPDPASY
jgi:hypothetical protein